jgi:hypothetical protein
MLPPASSAEAQASSGAIDNGFSERALFAVRAASSGNPSSICAYASSTRPAATRGAAIE